MHVKNPLSGKYNFTTLSENYNFTQERNFCFTFDLPLLVRYIKKNIQILKLLSAFSAPEILTCCAFQ